MEEENEVVYNPYQLINMVESDGRLGYWLTDWNQKQAPSPSWTEFDQFISEMRDYLQNNLPKKQTKTNNFNRPDNIGGYTFPSPFYHVERTENGGKI